VAPSLTTAVYARHIALRQQPDGHWETIDGRPPQSYSTVTATAIALRAIQIYSHPSLEANAKARIQRAARWLAATTPHDTEERTLQLYGFFGRARILHCAHAWPMSWPRGSSRMAPGTLSTGASATGSRPVRLSQRYMRLAAYPLAIRVGGAAFNTCSIRRLPTAPGMWCRG